jgi:diguanylate cyclase (GGDEF)-like protein
MFLDRFYEIKEDSTLEESIKSSIQAKLSPDELVYFNGLIEETIHLEDDLSIYQTRLDEMETIRRAQEQKIRELGRETIFASNIVDRSKRLVESLEERLDEKSTRDPLTGLLNLTALQDLYQSFAQNTGNRQTEQIGICFADIDDFKSINNKYGHKGGDAALMEIGNRLKIAQSTVLREGDIVGRRSGDEFIILLPGSNLDNSMAVIKKLQNALSDEPITIDGKVVQINMTYAVDIVKPGLELNEAAHQVNLVVNENKRHGNKNCVIAVS